jgi:hypothetical protein
VDRFGLGRGAIERVERLARVKSSREAGSRRCARHGRRRAGADAVDEPGQDGVDFIG